MHDETEDPKPHVHVHAPSEAVAAEPGLSIWFFVGILTLVYGVVLIATGIYEHFGHQPATVLARLEPTFWWGVFLGLFGAFYTLKFRPGKG